MDLAKIEELISVLQESSAQELCVRKGEFSVCVRKGKRARSSASPAAGSGPAQLDRAQDEVKSTEHMILAPMVGVFHAVDGIAKIGSRIARGQVVGSIESMKLLNDVISEVSGTVAEVLVEDGMPVEYGQPLCRLEPEEQQNEA